MNPFRRTTSGAWYRSSKAVVAPWKWWALLAYSAFVVALRAFS